MDGWALGRCAPQAPRENSGAEKQSPKEMRAGIAASPHCAERRICRCSIYLVPAPRKVWFPASRSWLTSSGVASHHATPSFEEPGWSTRLRRPKARWSLDWPGLGRTVIPSKTARCSAALLGKSSIVSRFAHRNSEEIREPRRTSERFLFRRRPTSWPQSEPESSSYCLPAEIGPLVTCLTSSPLPALRRPGPPSRSHEHHAPLPRVAEAKFLVTSLWITGISGTTIGTVFGFAVRLPIRSPCPTSAKCLNLLQSLPNQPISAA